MKCAKVIATAMAAILLLINQANGQVKQSRDSVIAGLRSEYDSLLVLDDIYPGSPLILAYHKFLHHDSQDEPVELFHGSLYDDHGRNVLPYTVYYRGFIEASSCKARLMWVRTKDHWYGYDMDDSTHESDYVLDVMATKVIDSGWVQSIGGGKWFVNYRNGRKNVYDVCRGYLFKSNDDVTKSIQEVWTSGNEIRFIVMDSPYHWRIIDKNKRSVAKPVFSQLSYMTKYDRSQLRDTSKWIGYFIDRKWYGQVDPMNGSLNPAYLLHFGSGRWWYCDNSTSSCIYKMRFEQVENRHPYDKIRQALVELQLKDKSSDRVVYRKRHWLNLNLAPGQVGSTQEFLLDEHVWIEGAVEWEAIIIDVR